MFRQYAVEISCWAYGSGWTYRRQEYDWLEEFCSARDYIKSLDGEGYGFERVDGRDLLVSIIGYNGDPMFSDGEEVSKCWLSEVNWK